MSTVADRPVRSDGNTRKATFGWIDAHMGGRIEINVTAEFAFEDEEPHMAQAVARALREHATRLDGVEVGVIPT